MNSTPYSRFSKINKRFSSSLSYLAVGLFCIVLTPCYCQLTNPGLQPTQYQIDADTTGNDTIINKSIFLTLFSGKPGRAALYSLLLPGGGQIYNRKWWKVPIAMVIDGACVSWLVTNRLNYTKFQTKLENDLLLVPQPSDIGTTRQLRNGYRKRSEYAWLIMVAGHMIPVFDAYVDRHLMDFDVSPELTFVPVPFYPSNYVYGGIKISIPLSK